MLSTRARFWFGKNGNLGQLSIIVREIFFISSSRIEYNMGIYDFLWILSEAPRFNEEFSSHESL